MNAVLEHMDALYAQNADPWRVTQSDYEQRKMSLLLACLPRRTFAHAFEPACGTGALSVRLAERCTHLLAGEASGNALRIARERTARLPNVRVAQQHLPRDWPRGERFDLIVLSEWLFYLEADEMTELADCCAASLAPGGVLVACHYRPGFSDRLMDTDDIHLMLAQALARAPVFGHQTVSHEEPAFRLDCWQARNAPQVQP